MKKWEEKKKQIGKGKEKNSDKENKNGTNSEKGKKQN